MTLQIRFLAIGAAICAYLMRGFTLAYAFLKHKGDHARTDLSKLIALLLCVPCFQASHFFFKLAYALQQRRALVMCREYSIVGVDKLGLEFEELRLEGLSIAQAYHRLRDILGRLERRQCARKSGNINHETFR